MKSIPGRRCVLLGPILLVVLGVVVGCSSIRVANREKYEGERLDRPERIWVYDFAVTPDDLPDWSEAAATHADARAVATEEEVAAARELGRHMATELVARIDALGLEAERAGTDAKPRSGDVAIVGFLASVEQGSGFKRVVVGFGAGAPEVTTHVEGYLATDSGFQKLGSGDASSKKRRAPGAVLPLAVLAATSNPIGLLVSVPIKVGGEVSGRSTVEGVGKKMAATIADELEPRFREQGWLER